MSVGRYYFYIILIHEETKDSEWLNNLLKYHLLNNSETSFYNLDSVAPEWVCLSIAILSQQTTMNSLSAICLLQK